mmetsp:Transcript_35806/g.78407  ORF Transcript_35806/g.78407 Transcript_35806/m.78407 type:complete len:224 (+) Transcript_35806:35-706(+)
MSSDTPVLPTPESISEWEMIARICGAAALAALIGFEREAKNKPANVKMHILVGAGSATFVGVALLNTMEWRLGDVNRVPAGVASGVGFLGAGAIFKIHDKVTGLTTAAGIWIVAAIGYACAAGYWFVAILTCVLVLLVQIGLLFFVSPHFWRDLKKTFQMRYDMELSPEEAAEHEEALLEEQRQSTVTGSGRAPSSTTRYRDSSEKDEEEESDDEGGPGIRSH